MVTKKKDTNVKAEYVVLYWSNAYGRSNNYKTLFGSDNNAVETLSAADKFARSRRGLKEEIEMEGGVIAKIVKVIPPKAKK